MKVIKHAPHEIAQGFVQCFVVDATTGLVVKEYPCQKNLILNQGMDQVNSTTWGDLYRYCSAGTGVSPTSDDSGTTTAAQVGTAVTLTGGSFVFTNTLTDAGNVIKWDTGEVATIVTVSSPTSVVVANSVSVSDAEFTVYRTNQTQLDTQLKRTSTYLTGAPYCQTTLTSNTLKGRRTYDFTAEVGTINYTEIALGWSSTGSTNIFSRILLNSPVAVTAGQQLRVTYELQITLLPAAPSAVTAIINGWPVAPATTADGVEMVQLIGLTGPSTSGVTANYQAGAGDVNEPSVAGWVFLATNSTAPASFGSTVNRTSGGVYQTATKAAYVAGNYYTDKSTTFAVGTANSASWRSMGMGNYDGGSGYYPYEYSTVVFVFNEAQTKLNTHTLTLTWRFSWSRVLS